MGKLQALARGIDAANEAIGRAVSWLSLVMVLVQFTVVVMRYVFGLGSLHMQHSVIFLHATVFLVAAGYTLKDDAHVRIDIFYAKGSPRQKARADLAGVLVFLWPFCALVWITAWPYVLASWRTLEGSVELGGLPGIFLLKTFILVYAVLLAVQGGSLAIRSMLIIAGIEAPTAPRGLAGGVS